MSVDWRFTGEQMKYVTVALRRGKVVVPVDGNVVTIDNSSFPLIVGACKALHARTLATKTKTVKSMQQLFNLQHVVTMLEARASQFAA